MVFPSKSGADADVKNYLGIERELVKRVNGREFIVVLREDNTVTEWDPDDPADTWGGTWSPDSYSGHKTFIPCITIAIGSATTTVSDIGMGYRASEFDGDQRHEVIFRPRA